MKSLRMLAFAGLTLLALSACTEDKNLASKDPATAVKNLAVAVRDNDFDRLSHIMVPPDIYAKLEAKDKETTAKQTAPTAEENKQFTDNLANYTKPDAEDTLFARIQPTLAQVGPQIPMYVAMGSGGLSSAINQSDKLSADEKTQANAILTAITKWATTAPLSDPEKAKQAIKVVVGTARDLQLTTLDAAQKLSFSEKLQKAGTAVGGLRKVLAVYGLDTDKALDSVTTEKKSESGDTAVVTVSFTLLDTPIKYDVQMVKIDDRWYNKHAVDEANDALSKANDASAPMAGPAMPPAAPDANAVPMTGGAAPNAAPNPPGPPGQETPATPASSASNGGG